MVLEGIIGNDSMEKWDRLLSLKDSLFLFDVEGEDFLIDTNNCYFCEVDDNVKYMFSCLLEGMGFEDLKNNYNHQFPDTNLDEVLDEIYLLYSNGFLTSYDRLFRISENSKKKERFASSKCKNDGLVSSLCLIMATDCNLRCVYCFGEGGNYNQVRKNMSPEIAKKSIDFLIRHGGRRKNLTLSFFGGEPLINFKTIKETVIYAEKIGCECGKIFSFGITTNGTLLTPVMMDFFVEHDFSYIVSIDGPQNVNDRFRIMLNGSGTYEIVLSKLNEFVKRYPQVRDRITLRCTFTSQTTDISGTLYHLKNLGFKNISIEPCSTKNQDLQIYEKNLEEIIEEYNKVAKLYLQSLKQKDDFSFFHMQQLFFQVENGMQRVTQCGAGYSYLTVDPNGAIYPCHRLVGDSSYSMGSIFQDKLDTKISEEFEQASVINKLECIKCWARYICGGGCHATAIQFNDNILQPYKTECELMKHRIKLGAWIYSKLQKEQNSNDNTGHN